MNDLCETIKEGPVGRSSTMDLLRQGTPEDASALERLVESSPSIHWGESWEAGETLELLLAHNPSILWLRHKNLCGALLFSVYRHPVAELVLLALRSRLADRQAMSAFFFHQVFACAEMHLHAQGVRWVSLVDPAGWLAGQLSVLNYRCHDLVMGYRKVGSATGIHGNRQVIVRRARPEDLATLVALDSAAFEPFWQLNEPMLRRSSEMSRYALVAEWEGTVVGYLLADISHSSASPIRQEAYISRVGVHPLWQSRGIGTSILREALVQMQNDGVREVNLNTQENNLHARHLYEHLGFQRTDLRRAVWAKPLAASEPKVKGNCDLLATS
jgi:[ribosomal protein S18]-alanine N-acetyltransferase